MCRNRFQRRTQGQIVSARKRAREHDFPGITGGTLKLRNWAFILRHTAYSRYLEEKAAHCSEFIHILLEDPEYYCKRETNYP